MLPGRSWAPCGAHPALVLGWRYCLGATAVAVATQWLLWLGIDPHLGARSLALVGAAGLLLIAVDAWRHRRDLTGLLRRSRLLLLVALVPVALAFASGLYRPLDRTDERLNFAVKARIFYHEGRLRPLAEPWVLHPRYPLQVPMLEVLTSGLAGRFDELAVKPPLAGYFAAMVFVFYGEMRRFLGELPSALFSALVAWMPFWTLSETGATSAAGDVPVACQLLALLVALRWCAVRPEPQTAIVAALLAVGLAFTKNEGQALVALAVLIIAGWSAWRPAVRRCALVWLGGTVLGLALLLAPWWWIVFHTPAGAAGSGPAADENYLARLTPSHVWAGLSRVPTTLRLFAEEMFLRPRHWVLLWWTLPLAAAAGWRSLRRDPAAGLAGAMLVGYLALLVLIWIISPWSPRDLAETALARLVGQIAPLGWWMVALACGSAGVVERDRSRPNAPPSAT